MIESQAESATRTWSVPECPFTIEYSLRALDDIRLVVMDAFFSLPRGGAEIGGVLLGRQTAERVTIEDYLPLECEHAFGPSFTLSPPDEGRLKELLAQARTGELQAVGWYHSHTRSEIFLSDADQAIHLRYFPEAWQIALVLKPHTFQPMRAGFFFRNPDGTMQCAATLKEFTLEPQPMRTVPAGMPPAPAASNGWPARRMRAEEREFIDVTAVKEPAVLPEPVVMASSEAVHNGAAAPQTARAAEPDLVEAAKETEELNPIEAPKPVDEVKAAEAPKLLEGPKPVEEKLEEPAEAVAAVEELQATEKPATSDLAAPRFLMPQEKRSGAWWKTMLAIGVGVALGAVTYQTRGSWVPKAVNLLEGSVDAPAAAEIGLTATDSAGQMVLHWDVHSPAVQQARGATLTISDGIALPRQVRLDRAHVLGGEFTYAREGEEVDVMMTLDEPGGKQAKDVTGFVGKMPEATAAAAPAGAVKVVPDPATVAENTRLKSELTAETEHVKRLQKALVDAQNELKQQQRKRLGAQNPDGR